MIDTPERQAKDLVLLAEELGVQAADLDDYVHEAAANMAAGINNDGLDEQVRYLVAELGDEAVEDFLRGLADANPDAA